MQNKTLLVLSSAGFFFFLLLLITSVTELKDIYELYDPELTGKIPQDDYATIVRGMGHNPSEKQLQEMFQETRPDPT